MSLLQTIQIISDVCFITDHVAYASSNKTSHLNRGGILFSPGVDASHVYVHAWALGCFHSLISTQTPSAGLRHPSLEEGAGKRWSECDQYPNRFWRALTASVDSYTELKSALQWRNQIWQSLEEGAGKRCSECAFHHH